MLALKLALTPALIAAATLAARRWGPAAGGVMVGLPLTSGPVAAFLAAEQGEAFAAEAAVATLAGLVAEVAFLLAYAFVARAQGSRSPALALLGAVAAYAATLPLLHVAPGAVLPTYAVVVAVVVVAARILPVGQAPGRAAPRRHPSWDLPARMLVATAMVVALTALAEALGARLTGLLSPFPIYAGVLAAFTHQADGPDAARAVVAGVLQGLLAFATFFAVLAPALGDMPAELAFLSATAAAALAILLRRWTSTRSSSTSTAP